MRRDPLAFLDFQPTDDPRSKHRKFQLSTGSAIHFKRSPQSTLWVISFERGTIPAALNTKFITFGGAFKAAEKYFLNHPQRKISIQEELPVDAS